MGIRAATIHDAFFLYQLGDKAFSAYNLDQAGVTPLKCAEHPGACVLIYEDGPLATPVAFCIATWLGDSAELTAIATQLEQRRHGVARQLLRETYQRMVLAAGPGQFIMRLEVSESNGPARRFFQSEGFEERYISHKYINGDRAIMMVKDIGQ